MKIKKARCVVFPFMVIALLCAGLFSGGVRGESLPKRDYGVPGEIFWKHESDTLEITVRKTLHNYRKIFCMEIWMQDPVRQVKKASSKWGENVDFAQNLLAGTQAVAGINGSAFFSENFTKRVPPGRKKADFYFTAQNFFAVTDRVVYATADIDTFTGICLEEAGLFIYQNKDSQYIRDNAIHTWGFGEDGCLVLHGQPNLFEVAPPHSNLSKSAARMVFVKVDAHNYVVVYVTKTNSHRGFGMKQEELVDFIMRFEPESAFNLDGGGSSRMLLRNPAGSNQPFREYKEGIRKILDMMYFVD